VSTYLDAPASSMPLSEMTLDAWQSYIESHPDATPFHHRNWIELLVKQYGFRLTIPALIDGDVVAALPFLETRNLKGRRKLIALPFSDCMRVIATDESAIEPFVAAVADDSFHRGRPVVAKTDQSLMTGAQSGDWFRHELELTDSPETVAAGYPSSLRRNLRRAKKHGLRFVRRTDADAMDAFYHLHLLTRRKLGVPVQPKSYFRRFVEHVLEPGLGSIGLVFDGEAAVAAAVFLEFNETIVYKYGASHPDALEVRPNEHLFHHAIRQAGEQGFRRFDFGVTHRRDEGLCRFKRKWGAREIEVFYTSIAGAPQEAPDDSLAVRIASMAIRRSPTFVCRALGELFYKYSQ